MPELPSCCRTRSTHARGRLFVLGVLLVFASALCYAVYLVAGSQMVKRVGSMRFHRVYHARCHRAGRSAVPRV